MSSVVSQTQLFLKESQISFGFRQEQENTLIVSFVECVQGEYRGLDGWCMLCEMESYKNDTGDHACTPCPVDMTTVRNGSTECGKFPTDCPSTRCHYPCFVGLHFCESPVCFQSRFA